MSKKQAPQLITAPRPYMNLAILLGGGLGFLWQDYLNLGNEGAFLLTGFCCFMAVFLLNVAWLIKTRYF